MKTKIRLFFLSCLLILGISLSSGILQHTAANNDNGFYYQDFAGKTFEQGEGDTQIGKLIKEDAVQPQD